MGLAREVWSREIGAHGPIVLATGAWLLWTIGKDMVAAGDTGRWPIVFVALVPIVALYIFSRAFDFITLEGGAVYLLMLLIAYRLTGWKGLLVGFFPFLYLAFLVPPPGWVIDQATAPLRTFVSFITTAGLSALGYPIVREGIIMHIAQYQLLVEDACAGMNSIVGLAAITLFYIYILHRASWRYALLLAMFIIPIAVVTNIMRVTALVLLTYYKGDAVAQGFLHNTTGIVLFAVALGLVFALDALLQRVLPRSFTEQQG